MALAKRADTTANTPAKRASVRFSQLQLGEAYLIL